jgi:arylformamidase
MRNDSRCSGNLTRRAIVAGATAGTLALAAHPASAQRCPSTSPSRAKGPLVWRDMDQQDLDESYDQSVYAFNSQTVNQRGIAADIAARQRLGAPLPLAYGTLQIERVLVYRTTRPNAPVLMFIHDGGWTQGVARFAGIAEVAVKAGAHFVDVDFSNVNDVGGDLSALADQCRRAVAHVYRNAASFGGDPNRIYLAGFSSGAHLAACVLTTDWAQEGLPADIVKGALLGSGIYDLEAIRLSSRASAVKFTDDMEEALSPQRHVDMLRTPLTLVYGTLDTPEFQRQTRQFALALQVAGRPARVVVGQGYNHLELLETLRNPYGIMGRVALEMMNLGA